MQSTAWGDTGGDVESRVGRSTRLDAATFTATTLLTGGASNVVVVGTCGTEAGAGLPEERSQQDVPAGASWTVTGVDSCLIAGQSGQPALIMAGAQQDTSAAAGIASTANATSTPTNLPIRVTGY